jgi:hypothetical protein
LVGGWAIATRVGAIPTVIRVVIRSPPWPVHPCSTTCRDDDRQRGERPAIGDQTETTSEDNMNEKRASKGPNWGLLLLIPAAVIFAKGAMRRRAMWESSWSGAGAAGRGYGHHGHFGGGEGQADGPGAFRLPPKIEWMLSTWHTRAHQATESTEPPTTSSNQV